MSREDEILQRLQQEQVKIADEEAFTNFIMSAIPEKKSKRLKLWQPVVQLLYAAAVVAIIYCLQPVDKTLNSSELNTYQYIIADYNNNFPCVDENNTPGDVLRCYVEQRKNNVSIIKQLKSQAYENFR